MHRILGRGQMKLIHRIWIFEILSIFLKQRDPMQLSTITILTSAVSNLYENVTVRSQSTSDVNATTRLRYRHMFTI